MNLTYENKISYEDYKELRASVNWREVSERQYKLGMNNSHYISVIKDKGKAVGLLRGLGDGGYYWLLSDVIIHPDYQGLGLGRKLMEDFLIHVDKQMRSGEVCNITLASSKGREAFYEKFGFFTRPHENFGAGMSMFKEKK